MTKNIHWKEEIPLSYSQYRMLFLEQLLSGLTIYNIPLVYKIKGALDLTAFEYAINSLIRRHEVLRTTFKIGEDSNYEQIIHKDIISGSFKVIELGELVEDYIERNVNYRFDLNKGPLIRVRIGRIKADEYVLIIVMHHIVSDGWSSSILLNELGELYRGYIKKEASNHKELEIQYSDYSIWQREYLHGEILESKLNYWKDYLSNYSGYVNLPTDKSRPKELTYKGGSYYGRLGKDLVKKIKALSSSEGLSLFMVLLSSFYILLSKYSGQVILLLV